MKSKKTKRIITTIITGRKPMIVEGTEFCFIADWISQYSVSGYVCSLIGDYESKFKQVSIQKTKSGERYIIADRKKFLIDNIRPATIDKEYLKRQLVEHQALRKTFTEIKESGTDVGYSIENQDFFIKNIQDYLDR